MVTQISIAIAEDNALARKSILKKLLEFDNLTINSLSQNGSELLENLNQQPVDVVLMDIEMPVLDGIKTTEKVKELYPSTKVLILTTFDDDDKIFNAILAGASGYLLKDENAMNIYKAIEDVHNGGAAMSAGIALKALHFIKATNNNQKDNEPLILTKRELEILTALKNGLSYKLIASDLFISAATVRKHIENIYRKLHVTNKISAINIGLQNKWLS